MEVDIPICCRRGEGAVSHKQASVHVVWICRTVCDYSKRLVLLVFGGFRLERREISKQFVNECRHWFYRHLT